MVEQDYVIKAFVISAVLQKTALGNHVSTYPRYRDNATVVLSPLRSHYLTFLSTF